MQIKNINSNTTLVKVKLADKQAQYTEKQHSNTTLVKVKFQSVRHVIEDK